MRIADPGDVNREHIPAINALLIPDVIEEQQLSALSVPIGRKNYHARWLLLASAECVCLCRPA